LGIKNHFFRYLGTIIYFCELSPNQKPTKYKQTHTRINNENKKKVGDILEKILEDPNTEVFPGISMRGIAGHGYYTEAIKIF
jgi:hypothetical protein